MTSQEIFNAVAAHLLKQGKRALMVPGRDRCAYRAPDGCKCAVGRLIPDELYSPAFENWGVERVLNNSPELSELFLEDLNLLTALQSTHDCSFVEEWPRVLRYTAERYGLSSAVVDTCRRAPGIDWVA